MKSLYNVLKDHKNPMIQDLVNSSYEHCCTEEIEMLVGDGDLFDSENCGTESAARICLVNPSFNTVVQHAVKKMEDAKPVIDQFGFNIDHPDSAPTNDRDETRLSDKLTVLINDIGIAMKRLEYALYRGKIYKKCPMAKYTFAYKCEVKVFINCLAANESFKARLLKDMRKIIDVLADPDCEVIRPICVDYNLIEVSEGQCWSVKDRCFLANPIPEEKIGLVTPRAFAKYDPRKQPDGKYFREILQNSLTEVEIGAFCEDFLRFLNVNKKCYKDKVPCLIGDANSGKTSLFQPILGLVHHCNIATVTKQRVFNKAMISKSTEIIFIDEASTTTMDIDDWKVLTQGGYTACDVKYQTAKSFINRCPMLITAQRKLLFSDEDQPAMDRRLRNYTFKSLAAPKKRAADWLRKHPMECVVWAAENARSFEDEDDSSASSDEEDDMENEDGTLPQTEREALRKMVLADVVIDPTQDSGDELEDVMEGEQNSVEYHDDSNECPSIAALKNIIVECSPVSIRHRQAARVLEMRLEENARLEEWQRQDFVRRQEHLIRRGVTRESVELLPEEVTDPLPTPIVADLSEFRRQALREELVARRRKARDAFQLPWLQSTERELHETTTKLLQVDLDGQTRASLEAYQDLLQEKLKNHHQNLGFNLDCTIALEERKRACVALGILSKEHRDLVKTLFQTLPTIQELGEPSGVTKENDAPPLSENDGSSDEENAIFMTQVPTSQVSEPCATPVRNTAPVRSCSAPKRKRRLAASKEGNSGKQSCNDIRNYYIYSQR